MTTMGTGRWNRPVSYSPAVFSLAFLAQRGKREIARFLGSIKKNLSRCLKFCKIRQGITFLSHPV